jgi:hypothetical protein
MGTRPLWLWTSLEASPVSKVTPLPSVQATQTEQHAPTRSQAQPKPQHGVLLPKLGV